MKKITLMLVAILVSTFGYSQQVLSEDFEGSSSIPSNWTNNDILGSGEVWVVESSGDAIGFVDDNNLLYDNTNMSGNYVSFDSDGYGQGPAENTALESPVFDCSSLTEIILKFDHFFSPGFGGEGYVEVFDGTNWIEVDSYITLPGQTPSNASFGTVEVDVSAELAGVTNAQVRFRWVGDFSWGWSLDNVEVFECTADAPGLATNPTPADGSTVQVTLTDNNETEVVFNWDAPAGDVTEYTFIVSDDPTLDENANTISGTFSTNNPGNVFLPEQTYFEVSSTYYWTVIPVNCAGTPDVAPTIWSFNTEDTLSNNEFVVENDFNHFINNNILNVQATTQFNEIEIFDINGKRLMNNELNGTSQAEVNITNLNKGMYIARIQTENGTHSFKFVK